MPSEQVLATTLIDAHGHRFSLQALERMVLQLKEWALRVNVEHDRSIPPFGKSISGRVIVENDESAFLLVTTENLRPRTALNLPSGEEVIELELENDHRPFAPDTNFSKGGLSVVIDTINFKSKEDLDAMRRDLERVSTFEPRTYSRKSIIPDPELLVRIPELLTQHLAALSLAYPAARFGKSITDALAVEIGKDAVRAYKFLKRAPIAMIKWAHPRDRPVTCVYVAPGTPTVEFLVRSEKPSVFARSLDLSRFGELIERAKELERSLGAVEVQYLYSEQEGWEFNFLVTRTGTIIGSKAAIDRQRNAVRTVQIEVEGLGVLQESEPLSVERDRA